MKLLGSKVMIKVLKEETTTKSGITLIEKPRESMTMATGDVIAVGQGLYNNHTNEYITPHIKVGDMVKFFMESSFPIIHEDEEYELIAEDAIIMILGPE